jgi:p-hydroxybenzoate 3-monooxygenase
MMRTQVVIVGGGPAGLMLSHLLAARSISSVILERRTKSYVLSRIRAGVLEAGTVQMLRENGLGARMDREGTPHDGVLIEWLGQRATLIDGPRYAGKAMMVYGQTQITEDLYAAREAAGQTIIEEAENVVLHDLQGETPHVVYERKGQHHRIDCDYIAGCDGSHGVCRTSIPAAARTEYERIYPFGWLGVLASVPPLQHVMYAHSGRGFALASQRGPTMSRYYIQVPLTDTTDQWPDDRFWTELKARLPANWAAQVVTGPAIEKSITPLRSFVCEPMQYGKLFLAGDAAHVVPPTGAKGLNLAFSDVYYLARALAAFYRDGNDSSLRNYSTTALRRVWGAIRLSWWLTTLLHVFPDETGFDRKIRESEYAHLSGSEPALANLVQQFVGLPL